MRAIVCKHTVAAVSVLLLVTSSVHGLAPPVKTRRETLLGWFGTAAAAAVVTVAGPVSPSWAASDTPDSLDIQDFLKKGMVSNPMGVSGQAGKSRPETGVILRDGSEVLRDSRTGDVLAEILLESSNPSGGKIPFLASFSSPWPLATGTVFDVECRDSKTGDGVFVAVTAPVGGKSIAELSNAFLLAQLLAPTGRFSFYGPPTDVKVQQKTGGIIEKDGKVYRILDLSFSTVSQATQTEFPRKARVAVTIPEGSSQAVMLVASSSATRWRKGSEEAIGQTIDSFRAIAAPRTSMKMRGKERRS